MSYGRLLLILFKLKSWRFLFMLIVAVAMASNMLLYKPVDSWMLRLGEKGLQIIGPKEFQQENIVFANKKYDTQIATLNEAMTRMSGVNFEKNNAEYCNSDANCQDKYFQALISLRRGKLAHYIDYESPIDSRTKLLCQMSMGSELYCPFVAYLAGISQFPTLPKNIQFRNAYVFRLLSSISDDVSELTKTRNYNTICSTDVNFPTVFPRMLMAQMILVVVSLIFYILVSTVSCINELKQCGFLQLMVRKNLSVLFYWLALWTITLLEMAIFAAILTMALNFQCPKFYPTSRIIFVFLIAFVQFCGVASFIYLLTVVFRSPVIGAILACAYGLVAVSFIVLNRMVIAKDSSIEWVRYIILVVPIGHIAEQVGAELLKGLFPRDNFISLVLPISVLIFVLLVLVTVYLDFVLVGGNGLRLPFCFLFDSKFWNSASQDRQKITDPPASTMVEAVSEEAVPSVRTRGLYMDYETCLGDTIRALNNLSATFYQDQISVIVGHNGSGKSTLLQILTGECCPTKGHVSAFNALITDPLSQYHIKGKIGYCPQVDALCSRLTVSDTLKLAVASSNKSWEESESVLEQILSTLHIGDKMNQCIGSLSISDKRKVSVILAFTGNPMLILLDDPFRDMDYLDKRQLWNLLHEFKRGRSIIFSTLFFREADAIADRMLFIVGGKIICAGSSFFFKRAFDCKFIIQIASKTEFHVTYMIRRIVAKFGMLRVRSMAKADLELELSLTDDVFLPEIVKEIESMAHLIDEFGIAIHSPDDAFAKLKAASAHEVQKHFKQGTIGYVADDVDRMIAIKKRPQKTLPKDPDDVEISKSMPKTLWGMIVVHFLNAFRSKEQLIVRVIVPIVLLLLLIVAAIIEKVQRNHQMKITFNLSDTTNFERNRGACFFHSSNNPEIHIDTIRDLECTKTLTRKNYTVLNIKAVDLPIEKFPIGRFQQAILDRRKLALIRRLCQNSKGACPIVYANDWCPDRPMIKEHDYYIGTYVDSSNYATDDVAMSCIEMYRNVMIQESRKALASKGGGVVNPDLDTAGILDIKSIFFPFYGVFAQIAILAIIPAFCLSDIVQDRVRGIRTQMKVLGVSGFHYWFCTLIHHWIQLAIIYLISVILLIAIILNGYTNVLFLAFVIPITLVFGLLNNILCVYIVGSFVKKAYITIVVYTTFCLLISLSVLVIQPYDLAGEIMIFLFPQFASIAPTFYGIRFIYFGLAFFASSGRAPNLLSYIFTVPHTRDAIIALVIHFVLLIVVFVVIENRHKCSCCQQQHPTDQSDNKAYQNCEEAAIVEEVHRLENSPRNEMNLMEVWQLKATNYFGRTALRNLTFHLKPGEVFGLIGPVGSGKGSAVRTIVGIQREVSGQVHFRFKNDWLPNTTAAQHGLIGYCPEHDPLFDKLTVYENLQFYARVIGVSFGQVASSVKLFELNGSLSTIVMYAETGVKRRLTLAIAALSSPKFIAMDQVTGGVDPEGRKILWKNVKSLCMRQRGMLVVTQDMEEAETLCDRICILNGGFMAALCTVDELVDRYKRMYFLEIEINTDGNEPIESSNQRKAELLDIVKEKFPDAIVISQMTSRLQLAIPIKSMGRLSTCLRWLVNMKKKLGILFFSLHYATIEQTVKAIVVLHEGRMLQEELKQQEPVTA